MKNISPLRYPGGKSQIYDYVRELVVANNATTYIEPYMGGMGIALKLLFNNDVEKIMVNDFDKAIYAFWYSVLNYTEQLIKKIETTPITIEEWKIQRDIQNNKDNCDDLLSLGFSTLFLNRTNRSGIIKAGVIGGLKQDGYYKLDCRFNREKIIEKITLIASLKKRIKLYNMDAEKFIRLNISRTKNSFTFFDPPYYKKGPGLYTNFYNHENHLSLAKSIKKYMSNKNWILTYDVSDEIFKMYSNLRNEKYYLNYSVTKPSKGIEYIFYSKQLIIPIETQFLKKA
ncbi:DNA adenine methylase [Streptococcus mitis]|uniref:site-specific DNA-methyltransferase (adenine-specific) n=1 Tax=Streptococcus mitis SK1080 TaxID=1008453 RepID=F9HLQ5_STRMT|nr:DNA adenine methylase [Streptococcus mitis]EGP69401.1 D12 class N6 adenine-specific DNA methyltransferase [Streptococcus mitis SK1080]